MHYVEFPAPQRIVKYKGAERTLVTYQEFTDEHVWTDGAWRKDGEFARCRNRLMKLFDDAFAKGARGVGLEDKDYEKWEPIAALRGPNLSIPPENTRPISVFTDAAMFATTVEPDWFHGPRAPKAPADKPAKAAPTKPEK